MKEKIEKSVNIPGVVNGLSEFTVTIPVFFPDEIRTHMSDEELKQFIENVARTSMSPFLNEKHNEIDIFAEKPTYGAGDLIVQVHLKKPAIRTKPQDYYRSVVEAARNFNYYSEVDGFGIAKNFMIEGHMHAMPNPLEKAA